ncbi:tripartite tricarboxylate transporter permease [Poseidonocella sp. HB161398]|uniref:tripartite tricarboxylate transporter permease n=1 Tax=Poseidonocella sp. HB161398 TaxID=2320855 RepID=UPI00110811EA|nr:tripartite tricarboxylate transporter permease [Poseidonocella sp. HB161398]
MFLQFAESFAALLHPLQLLLMFGAAAIGLCFGALPGLNAMMAVVIMLPLTYVLSPAAGLAVLIAAYVGGISGGLVSAALMRIPGTPSSVATTFDAFPLARQGKAVKALGTGIVASFIGGVISLAILIAFAPAISRVAVRFGPFEYTAMTALALTLVGALAGRNMVKGLLAALLGLALSLIGFAPIDGTPRFTFGQMDMMAGIGLVPFMIGLFAIPQLITEALSPPNRPKLDVTERGIGVTFAELRANAGNILRSSLIGTGIGVLPGIGGGASNLVAYAAARKRSKTPERFGTGAVEGIYASESANNASIGGALLPLLTLGIPGDAVTAMLIGGFQIHGLQPGPLLFRNQPDVITAIYAAFLISALMVLIVQLTTIRIFPRVLLTPKRFLVPVLLVLSVIGAYGADSRAFDIWIMLGVGLLGFGLEKMNFPLAPMVLGFVLGPILEQNLRRAMIYSDGTLTPFLTQPVAAACTLACAAVILLNLWQAARRRRPA